MKKIGLIFFCLFLFSLDLAAAEKIFPPAEKPERRFFLGEKIVFHIRYLGLTVGEASSEVKEIVKINGRDAYHIEIRIRSRSMLEWVYKVRDSHHTYIDVERLHSLRCEKRTREGSHQQDEVMDYDQENHIGRFYSRKDNSRKEMLIPKNVQDQISCGFFFRTLDIRPDSKYLVQINADEKNWETEILTHKIKKMKIKKVGIFQAIEVEPVVMFQGFFVRRGKIRGWMSMDVRRIPLMAKAKVPVLGDITAVLAEYKPGKEI